MAIIYSYILISLSLRLPSDQDTRYTETGHRNTPHPCLLF